MTENKLKKTQIRIWIGVFILVLMVSMSALALYIFENKSIKETYFLAEVKSLQEVENYIEKKYEEEINWYKKTKEYPFKQDIELSADYNPNDLGADFFGLNELINNALLHIETERDYDKKVVNGLINLNLAGITVDDVFIELGEEELKINSPLIADTLFITTKDLAKKINDESLGFKIDNANFTELVTRQAILSDEDKSYLLNKYGEIIYRELKEDHFSTKKEKLKINNKDLRTEKISLHLTEEEFKQIVDHLIKEIVSDDRLLGILSSIQTNLTSQEIIEFLSDFNTQLQSTQVKGGLQSDVWTYKNLIVARKLNLNLDDSNLEFIAKQEVQNNLSFDYKVVNDSLDNRTELSLSGVLENKEDINDEVILTIVDQFDSEFNLIYTGEETKTGDEKEFERTLKFNLGESLILDGSLHWDGIASYDEDQMNGEHEIYIEFEGFTRDLFTLYIDQQGKRIKELTPFVEKGHKRDLNTLDETDVESYLQDLF